MFIRVMSDLHLEFCQGNMNLPELPEDKDTVLILAGDIGLAKKPNTYRPFIENVSRKGVFMHNTKKLLVIVAFLLLGTTLLDAADIHEAVNNNDIQMMKKLLKEDIRQSQLKRKKRSGMPRLR